VRSEYSDNLVPLLSQLKQHTIFLKDTIALFLIAQFRRKQLKSLSIQFGLLLLEIPATQWTNRPINPASLSRPLHLAGGFNPLGGDHFPQNRFEAQAGFILAQVQQFLALGKVLLSAMQGSTEVSLNRAAATSSC
jgi:hypothetical protein